MNSQKDKKEKFCPMCKEIKTIFCFGKNKARYDKLTSYCISCKNKRFSIVYQNKIIKKSCRNCDIEFFGTKNKLFCSKKCRWQVLKKKVSGFKKCLYCAILFTIRTNKEKLKRFCSKKCSATWVNKNLKRDFSKITGKNHYNWKGGYSLHTLNKTIQWRNWRKSIFIRDNYTCKICGKRGGKLNPDHILPLKFYSNLAFDINNGRTLCIDCHRRTPTYGLKLVHGIRKYGMDYLKRFSSGS